MNITVNYHNSIIINNNIVIDPLKIDSCIQAKYIFITHPHWDHYSIEDINKITTVNTTIICPEAMREEISNNFNNKIIFVVPNQYYKIDNISFSTFPSYNINKQFHPKDNLWVGYNIIVDNQQVAIIGDSDLTQELENLKCDILLIPIGGTYTMNVEEAAKLTNTIKPKIVIPTHYGEIVGNKKMGIQFQKLIDSNITCSIQL